MSIDRVTVIGTGVIGASVAFGLKATTPHVVITAYDRDPATVQKAAALGAVDRIAPDAAAAVEGSDVVVVAIPVDGVGAVFRDIGPALARDTVVTDVGSVKKDVVGAGEAVLGARFVGGHPMAGSERAGIGAADADMFRGAWWILTPTPMTDPGAYKRVVSVVEMLGATPLALDPGLHDDLVGRLSHVPQLVASALVDLAAGAADRTALLPLAGTGFRDVTRIAASDPDLWLAILRGNRPAVTADLRLLRGRLDDLAAMLEESRWDDLRNFLAGARAARTGLFAKPDLTGVPVTVSLPVPDRPGVLAEVTTAAGEQAINIEDLDIVHSTEGGPGTLRLVVIGEARGRALADVLRARGHHAVVTEPGEGT